MVVLHEPTEGTMNMTTDNGNWLSAEQAVMPDGTQRDNLQLINKKLPSLAPTTENTKDEAAQENPSADKT